MKISLKWLQDYVNISVSPLELANLLTMAGNEVKALETLGSGWQNVFVGQITAIKPHPNADRLRLATVDLGKGTQTVVCGAPNLYVGDKIAFAVAGAELLDGHTGQTMRLKTAKIRGVESSGMICSEMELGISQKHEGILVLPASATLGTSLADLMGDSILDLDVTPNRPDCLSVMGIAWETAALTRQKVRLVEPQYQENNPPIEEKFAVEIVAADLCPRYSAALVTGVKIGPSPEWMQERLKACGMRPINNIVDISNYVMLEYGQPLHTFDYDKLIGQTIIVRRARDGESLVSLDGVERKLTSDMLVIADAARAVAIAGVMGGANTEVSPQTQNILIEAANFAAVSIHRTGETLNLPSEARYRFERGIAAGLTVPAMKRAAQLIAALGGGTAARGFIDVYPGKSEPRAIPLSPARLQQLLGAEVSNELIIQTLVDLGFTCRQSQESSEIMALPPYWRSDIKITEDLIEEVARIIGYDKIPNTLLGEPLPAQNPEPIFGLKRDVRRYMVDLGFDEVMNFSLTGLESLNKLRPGENVDTAPLLRVANPMTADMEYLRTDLRATLLSAFAANRRFEDGSIRLFEVGKIYLKKLKDLPDEREMLCAVMGGQRFAKSWQDKDQLLDFFDVKGFVEGLLQRLGLKPAFQIGHDASLHVNNQAEVLIGETKIGIFGEVNPAVLSGFEIAEPLYLCEIDLKTLVEFAVAQRTYQPVPRFPATVRDMALVLESGVTHAQVQAVILSFPLVEEVEIFDVYAGGQLPAGKKSLAYHITYRSADKTLTDEEVSRVHQKILDRLSSDLKAVLRS